jgi:hypothetical protein
VTSFSIVNKNANKWLWPVGLLVFAGCMAYVVNALFIHPGQYVEFGIFDTNNLTGLILLFGSLAVLTVVNLGLEAYKWWGMTNKIESVSFIHAFNSILTGLAVGFVTPNRLGDFPGRAILYSPGNRAKIILMNLLSGYAQFVVICLLGLFSLCFISSDHSWLMQYNDGWRWAYLFLIGLLLVFHLLVMFNTRSFLIFFSRFKWLKPVSSRLESFPSLNKYENIFAIQLSFFRSLVYTAQLVMLLHFMCSDVPVIKWVMYANIYFFVLTVAPSFMLNKLGIRESLAVMVFYDICPNPVVPVVSVLLLWIMNQVIPALVGAFILFKKGRS